MTTDLATALANLQKAHDRLRMANMRASDARKEEAEAINEANKAQKEFDALVASMKKTAPSGSDWRSRRGTE